MVCASIASHLTQSNPIWLLWQWIGRDESKFLCNRKVKVQVRNLLLQTVTASNSPRLCDIKFLWVWNVRQVNEFPGCRSIVMGYEKYRGPVGFSYKGVKETAANSRIDSLFLYLLLAMKILHKTFKPFKDISDLVKRWNWLDILN